MRVKGQRYEMSLTKLAKIDFSKTALFTLFILCAYTTGQRDTEYVSLKAIDIELSELQANYFSKLILANFLKKIGRALSSAKGCMISLLSNDFSHGLRRCPEIILTSEHALAYLTYC
jgi:hypothetical protein